MKNTKTLAATGTLAMLDNRPVFRTEQQDARGATAAGGWGRGVPKIVVVLVTAFAVAFGVAPAPVSAESADGLENRARGHSELSPQANEYRVTADLRVRTEPRTNAPTMGEVFDGNTVKVLCQDIGTNVRGNAYWDFVEYEILAQPGRVKRGWVSDHFVSTSHTRLPSVPLGNCPAPLVQPGDPIAAPPVPAPAPAAPPPPPPSARTISWNGSGWCLDSDRQGKAYMHVCNAGTYQQWALSRPGTPGSRALEIRNVETGLCLASGEPLGFAGVTHAVLTQSCTGGANQRWAESGSADDLTEIDNFLVSLSNEATRTCLHAVWSFGPSPKEIQVKANTVPLPGADVCDALVAKPAGWTYP